jgi:hypothetical protein
MRIGNRMQIRFFILLPTILLPISFTPMPIYPTLQLTSISDADFAVIDEAVMDCAYAAHNKFGPASDLGA